jgi:hypothetical protein
MSRFLYVFGYETPGQARANTAHGWDDEDSRALFIEAPSSEEALSWGRQVSEAFVAHLYGDAPVSWLADGYAHWIELEPSKVYEADHLAAMPTVRPGEYPNWQALLGHPGT